MSKQKLILAYVCLVGLPLLGLVGIIRAGQHLNAPISVGGVWYVDADFGPWQSGPCRGMSLAGPGERSFSIAQSGSDLVLTIDNPQKTVLPGQLRGSALTLGAVSRPVSPGNSPDCGNPKALSIIATVTGQARQRVLSGTLSIGGCPECPAVAFRATRQNSRGTGDR